MISLFLTELKTMMRGERIHILLSDLVYYSESLGRSVIVPEDFNTDLASVPRLPIVYGVWGNRAHREAVLHDYLYRVDSDPVLPKEQADKIFLEAMEARGVSLWIRYPMYAGVRMGGWGSFHKRLVGDELK